MPNAFIPFADPHAACAQRTEALEEALRRVLQSGWYILGEEVAHFEREFAQWLGANMPDPVPHVLGVASGTDAVEVAIRGLQWARAHAENHTPAEERRPAVFTVSHTAVATVAAIERAGAVPVLVDIDPQHLTLDPTALELAIKEAYNADLSPVGVVAVHIYGHPCHMDDIRAVADKAGLWVLEDCAQAHGARFRGRAVGSMGHAAAFSHYPTKNLGALGDAGSIATADPALAATLSALRQYGWQERYVSAVPGVNSRLDPMQAAVLRVNLRHLDVDMARRIALAARYTRALAAHPALVTPHVADWAEHAWHLYVVRVPDGRRDALLAHLQQRNIGAALHYPKAVHQQPAYAQRLLQTPQGLPVTTALYEEILTLPFYPQMDETQITRVLDAVGEWRP